MLKQKISILFVILMVFGMFGTISSAEDLNLTSPIALLMDMETGQILYEKQADVRWAPASTTKILTALVALEHAESDMEMKASSNAINNIPWDYGRAGIEPGEILTFRDLLHFVLIISANEGANIIAENISASGNLNDFLTIMNQKALDLGMKNSHFTNTYGLDEENHYTTARDLAVAAREAMKFPLFREVVGKKIVPLPDTNLRKSEDWEKWHIESTNKLLDSSSDYYSQVTGIKTGYTGNAKRCLVFSAVNAEGLELLGVILGAEDNDILFMEAQFLLEYGYKNFKIQTLVYSGEHSGRYEVMDSVDNIPVELQTLGSVTHLLPVSPEVLQAEVTVNETLMTPFTAPIEKGQILGQKTWVYKGEEIGAVQLVANNDIEKTLQAKVRDRIQELVENNTIRNLLILIGLIIVLLIALRIVFKSTSRRRKSHSRNYRL